MPNQSANDFYLSWAEMESQFPGSTVELDINMPETDRSSIVGIRQGFNDLGMPLALLVAVLPPCDGLRALLSVSGSQLHVLIDECKCWLYNNQPTVDRPASWYPRNYKPTHR